MKTQKYLFIPLLLVVLLSAFFAGSQVQPAFAQTQCLDAAGAAIPCPPTDDIPCGQPGGPACSPPSDNGDNNDDGNKRPTVTPVPPTLTPTSLPISAAPTSLPEENYLGSCSNSDGNVFDCFEKFKCEDGLLVMKVDLYTGNGTKYDFYCIPDETVPQLDLPLSIPDPVGKDANWTGGCPAGAGLDACLDLASDHCSQEGGEISIWYDDDGAGVYCQNQSEASQPGATEAAVIAPALQDPPAPQPDLKPSTPWGPLGLGILVIIVLIGLLVPAVQKVRSAAARTQSSNSARMINNKNPELLKNQGNDGTEAGYMRFDDIKGESSENGGTPPPPSPPSSSDLATWQANYGSSASQGKPTTEDQGFKDSVRTAREKGSL